MIKHFQEDNRRCIIHEKMGKEKKNTLSVAGFLKILSIIVFFLPFGAFKGSSSFQDELGGVDDHVSGSGISNPTLT